MFISIFSLCYPPLFILVKQQLLMGLLLVNLQPNVAVNTFTLIVSFQDHKETPTHLQGIMSADPKPGLCQEV